MEILNDVLPVLLYILCAILLVVVIILVIKLIKTVDKTNVLLDDLEEKSKSLNGLFSAIDMITDTIASVNDRVVEGVVGFFAKLFGKRRRKKEREEEDEYE